MTDIISKEHRTTSDDFPAQENSNGTTTTGADKVANPPSSGEPAPTDEELPPQLHAGKVGYGPNYHQGPTAGEKVSGFKEELIGKVKKDHELEQHGHQLRTGELKRREEAEDQGAGAFGNPQEKQQTQSQPPSSTTNADATTQQRPSESGVYTGGEETGKRVGEERADLGSRTHA